MSTQSRPVIVTGQSGIVTAYSGIVTNQSGNDPESVTINRIPRSRSAGLPGHVRPDCPVTLRRNTQGTLFMPGNCAPAHFFFPVSAMLSLT